MTLVVAGIHKNDIDEILTVAMTRINKKYTSRYTMQQLINGYRRFDPVRGMSYILDLLLKSPNGEKVVCNYRAIVTWILKVS